MRDNRLLQSDPCSSLQLQGSLAAEPNSFQCALILQTLCNIVATWIMHIKGVLSFCQSASHLQSLLYDSGMRCFAEKVSSVSQFKMKHPEYTVQYCLCVSILGGHYNHSVG